MFRKVLLSSVTAVGVLSPLAASAPASAHEWEHHHHVHHRYHVYIRPNCNLPWRCAGEFSDFRQAECAVRDYRVAGWEAYVN